MVGEKQSFKHFSGYANVSSEIRSHSSALFNERLNALFLMYDDASVNLEINPDIKKILQTRSLLSAIWRNVRPIVSHNPLARKSLNLDTSKPGIFTVDAGFAHIQELITEMITYRAYTYQNLIYTVQQIQNVEVIIREILQYFSYFIRTEQKKVPDINVAGQKYKYMADDKTVEEFKELLGARFEPEKVLNTQPLDDSYFDDVLEYLEDSDADEREEQEHIERQIDTIVKSKVRSYSSSNKSSNEVKQNE